MSDSGVKACVDCQHFKGPANYYSAQMQLPNRDEPTCENPKAVTRDPIYGKAFCRNERNDKKGCGKQGKLWASKTTEQKS